jgi:1,4-alpha-glucan branching enzyme
MILKNYSKTGKVCRVTFKYDNPEDAQSAVITGNFNDWSLDAAPMKKLKDNSFSITLSLEPNQTYCFRYVLDGSVWVNDHEADKYIPNEYGEDNSVIEL